ncbi:bifunctional lysylphosphatidylglycerol flippase/synthetase MprF [Rhizobium sp. AQ_MP]|uniref:bifunctional lysylphosphatidylglycerol flippase/synthetase MprF n=1 Tax=Rhizobium sp. AQ_MP TaxID=2761536 RepID=UPI00163A5571|nr:bifunctional lysylphosphatidylglycerol flippase/synthetase MprF [Rhizobium sp. AQ_MP]MBC2772790.1 bifunctional lysylphosphatidylglycerol flippase/synthetase MprF [Rhizobium sp. AQ_MP]
MKAADAFPETALGDTLPPPSFFNRHAKSIAALAALVVFAAVGYAVYRLTEEVTYADVIRSVEATSSGSIALAVMFTALSFATLCFYDLNALAHVGRKRPWPEVALTAFSAYAVGNVAGFGALSGGAIRYRAYSRAGLSPDEIGRIIAFVTVSFSLGLALLTTGSLIPMAGEIAPLIGISSTTLATVSAILLLSLLILLGIASRRGLTVAGRTLRLPDTATLSRQFLVTVLDVAFSASVLYALLPAEAQISWPAFFAVYAVAIGIGIVSHVPAGLGVFEAVILAALSAQVPGDALLASLVAYRAIYYVLPLVIAILVVTATELRQLSSNPLAAGVARTAGRLAPILLATLALVLGAMLVLSSVTPTPGGNLDILAGFLPLPLVEGAHLIASILGLMLVIVARGLAQRLDGAWWGALVIALLALVLSLAKAVAVYEAALLAILVISLIPSRRLFHRKASIGQALTSAWLLAIAVLIGGAIIVLFFVYRDVQYSHDLWWQFAFEAEAPRSLRAMLGLTVLAMGVCLFSLMRPAAPAIRPADDAELAKAVAILDRNDVADANLVRTGDKSLMFSPDGDAFLMYGRQGRSLIAFLDPVGPKASRDELVWQFVETARASGCRAAFYQSSPAILPVIADAGMKAFKLGEMAVVDLELFDLKGGKWAGLRQAAAKGERDGLTFEIIPTEGVPAILDDLRRISDAWLDHHRAKEKGFSLGAFTEAYMSAQPVAILRHEGRIVAFADILLTDTREEASIDLMRFAPDAPKGAMDFLFVRLMTTLRDQGYRHFNLGMAPLSGLSRREVAPVWDRVANTFYEHGERYYNFKGLRAFKSKFHPDWQPRYLAVAGGLNPVLALLDATLLIGGGLKGVVKK